ncbi:MAG TPA: nuclear pore complex subunit [Bacteroidales bacterium]|nr:nuclear pore complex subunit [Bacteroidales bacterium]
MTELLIEGTSSTPNIYFDKNSGKFEIKGKSFPEESRIFFAPVFEWLNEYSKNPNEETLFEFKMEYFNSSSSLIILEILNVLDSINKAGKKVSVSWSHLQIDDDMLEAGEEYSELVSLPFEYHALEEADF